MNINKAHNRDRKKTKKDKMVVDSKSVFVIEQQRKKRDAELRKRRKEKMERTES